MYCWTKILFYCMTFESFMNALLISALAFYSSWKHSFKGVHSTHNELKKHYIQSADPKQKMKIRYKERILDNRCSSSVLCGFVRIDNIEKILKDFTLKITRFDVFLKQSMTQVHSLSFILSLP